MKNHYKNTTTATTGCSAETCLAKKTFIKVLQLLQGVVQKLVEQKTYLIQFTTYNTGHFVYSSRNARIHTHERGIYGKMGCIACSRFSSLHVEVNHVRA